MSLFATHPAAPHPLATRQDHYDFGMRALKSVLVMAGAAKRAASEGDCEDAVLISAIRDANVPKFTAEVPLFSHQEAGRAQGHVCPLVVPAPSAFVCPSADCWPTCMPQDVVLFEAIVSDLFPDAAPPVARSAALRRALAASLQAAGLQPTEELVGKAVQLRETLGVRFGVMLVGQAGGRRQC